MKSTFKKIPNQTISKQGKAQIGTRKQQNINPQKIGNSKNAKKKIEPIIQEKALPESKKEHHKNRSLSPKIQGRSPLKNEQNKQTQKVINHSPSLPISNKNQALKKDELKNIQNEIQTMKNKVALLKQQLKKQQQHIQLNKHKTEDIIKKKINVNRIHRYVIFFRKYFQKQKDFSLDLERTEELRKKNYSLRKSHQNQMQNILKAIYLVKLDDARQIKNESKMHKKRIQQMNSQIWSERREKKKKILEQSQKAKQKYQHYWKEKKLGFQNQYHQKFNEQKMVSQKKYQLDRLKSIEIKLLQDMNKFQTKQTQSKKQYLAALSLPAKQVAEALDKSKNLMTEQNLEMKQSLPRTNTESIRYKQQNKIHPNSRISIVDEGNLQDSFLKHSSFGSSSMMGQYDPNRDLKRNDMKIPKSSVNPQKLKIVLKELKRMQKQKSPQNSQERIKL